MLTVYARSNGKLSATEDPIAALAQKSFVWADICAPAESRELLDAEIAIETALGIDVPTPLERRAYEQSSRFYEERDALFLTATLMGQRSEGAFIADAVTFILSEARLITVRTVRPRAFTIGEGRASARITDAADGGAVLIALLEGVVERVADVLQETAREATTLSSSVFVLNARSDLQSVLRQIGKLGVIAALAHESLSSLNRLTTFTAAVCKRHGLPAERFRAFTRDVQELERQAEALQTNLNFLLEAALGLVTAAQNRALQTLAVVTVAFAPPTLVASIFGMNFDYLGWIGAPWGPGAAFAIMAAASSGLIAIGRWRKWF